MQKIETKENASRIETHFAETCLNLRYVSAVFFTQGFQGQEVVAPLDQRRGWPIGLETLVTFLLEGQEKPTQ